MNLNSTALCPLRLRNQETQMMNTRACSNKRRHRSSRQQNDSFAEEIHSEQRKKKRPLISKKKVIYSDKEINKSVKQHSKVQNNMKKPSPSIDVSKIIIPCSVVIEKLDSKYIYNKTGRNKQAKINRKKYVGKKQAQQINQASKATKSSKSSIILHNRLPLETSRNKKVSAVKGAKCVKKSSKSKRRSVKSHSDIGLIPIDDLSLSQQHSKRKTASDGFKLPGKNTLKRKRYVIKELKKKDEEHEDDIYESKKFDYFKDLFKEDSQESDTMFEMSTPKLGMLATPQINRKCPVFKDCISPGEYAMIRKAAEECMYRNKKRSNSHEPLPKSPVFPEKKKLEYSQVLENACRQQEVINRMMEGDTSDKENSYFSDF